MTVKTTVAIHGARRHYGTLVAADESNVRLAPKDAPAGTLVDLPVEQIDRIRTVLTWGAGSGRPAATKHSKDPAHIKDAAS